jgi:hypothetical protein
MPSLQHKGLHSSNMTGFLLQVDQCSEGEGREGKEPSAQLGKFWIKLDSRCQRCPDCSKSSNKTPVVHPYF